MSWFNGYGLLFIVIILIPNIVYAVRMPAAAASYRNRALETVEQIGRYGCMVLMAFHIPYTYGGFWFQGAQTAYLAVNSILVAAYCLLWVVFWRKHHLGKALALSVLPTLVFVFSAVLLCNLPLFVFAVLFGVAHIQISCRQAETIQS